MGRKKIKTKIGKNREEAIFEEMPKRSIAAIFLFALSILFFLGFVGSAGVLGAISGQNGRPSFRMGKIDLAIVSHWCRHRIAF